MVNPISIEDTGNQINRLKPVCSSLDLRHLIVVLLFVKYSFWFLSKLILKKFSLILKIELVKYCLCLASPERTKF